MNEKLKGIARQAADVLITKLDDSEEKLLAAIAEHIAAHADDDKCPPFSVSFAIKLDWDANKVVHRLSFTQQYKDETIADIADPNQPELFPKRPTFEEEEEFQKEGAALVRDMPTHDSDGDKMSPGLREATRKFVAVMEENGGSVTAGGKTVEFKKGGKK